MQASVFIATSLDGFIARKNGAVDWLMAADTSDTSQDYGYGEFFGSVDCMVMGRNSMEVVLSFGEWPYEGKRVIVLSTTLTEAPAELAGKIELYSGSITDLANRLEEEGHKRLYIDGGKTIQSFINEELITDLTINTIPILLGEGLRLFGETKHDIKLKHIETKSYPNGFVMSTYEI
jgi:dihydrofolate reductase